MEAIREELLRACIKKERRAQHELYRLCYSFLSSVCLRYVRNKEDADALLNLGFLKILNNLANRKADVPVEFWMRRIMINTVIDEYRKNKQENKMVVPTDFSGFEGEHEETAMNDYIKKADAEYIFQLVAGLPDLNRKVFNLVAVDGLSHKEAAELLNINESTSRWYLNLARNELKKKLSCVLDTLLIEAS